METYILPIGDNYAFLLAEQGEACVIDPTAADPVLAKLEQLNLQLTAILNTHGHYDHTGGNQQLHSITGAPVLPRPDGLETLQLLGRMIRIIPTPGHTQDSVCFYVPGSPGLLFTGDTLFVAGCGRIFSGTAGQLWHSLQALAALPDDTLVYCGHEYTLDNLRFAGQSEPANPAIAEYAKTVHIPTVPSTIGLEKKINVFIRAKNAETFARLRKTKDHF